MSLFGGEGVKAVIADICFTVTIGSVGYESRHVSDPCIVSFPRFGVFEKEEVYVVLAIFVRGEILDGKGEVFRHWIDSVQIY